MKVAPKKPASEARDAHLGRILETTTRLLAEVGAEKITIRGLAAASGVATATLYNRFGGKEKLISLAVIDHFERNVQMGFVEHSGEGLPLTNMLTGLKMLAATCHENPTFVRAVVGMYFKVGEHRDMPKAMFQSLHSTWLLLITEMREQGALRDWVLPELLAAEMCERVFAVIQNWIHGEMPDKALLDRLAFGTLSILLGSSQGAQAEEIEIQIRTLLGKPGFKPKARRKILRA